MTAPPPYFHFFPCVIVFLLSVSGCGSGYFIDTIDDPDQLVGEWESWDGGEYMNITKEEAVDKGNRKEHRYSVIGKGRDMYASGVNVKDKRPLLEAKGTFVCTESHRGTFRIHWAVPVSCEKAYGLFQEDRLAIYTYITDPDFPGSMIRLYRVENDK